MSLKLEVFHYIPVMNIIFAANYTVISSCINQLKDTLSYAFCGLVHQMQNIFILVLVIILSSIGHIATDIYLPSMPHIAAYFDTPDTLVKMTLSAYMLS